MVLFGVQCFLKTGANIFKIRRFFFYKISLLKSEKCGKTRTAFLGGRKHAAADKVTACFYLLKSSTWREVRQDWSFQPIFNPTSCHVTQVSGSQCVKILHLLNIDYCGWFHGYSVWIRRRRWHPTPVLLLGKSHGQRSLVGCGLWGLEESDTTEWLHFHFSFSCIGEGNGNPLQCSCLENPRDAGAWWAAVYGVTQSDMTEVTQQQQQQQQQQQCELCVSEDCK